MTPPSDQPRMCVLGSIIMDLLIRAPRLPTPGETVLGGPLLRLPGGKGANQAVAAARVGCAVSLIGTVGDDEAGQAMIRAIQAEGVDISHIVTDPSAPTGTAVVSVADDGANAIIVSPGANMCLTRQRVEHARSLIAQADLLIMQLEVPLEAAAAAATIAQDAGTTVVLNAAPVPPHGLPAELLATTDILIVNETEAAALSPASPTIDAALDRLATMGPRLVVATLGERGVRYIADRSPIGNVDAFAIEAVDTTGAGDAFVGAFATRWAEHKIGGALDALGVMDALCWGAAAGALAACRQGAMPSLPHRGDVIRMLRGPGSRGATGA